MASSQWLERDDVVQLQANGKTLFEDRSEHWHQALLRLMGWDDRTARAFVEAVVDAAGGPDSWTRAHLSDRVRALIHAGQVFAPEPETSRHWQLNELSGLDVLGAPADTFWSRALAGDVNLAVVGSALPAHGVLVQRDASGNLSLAEAPEYEEDYFEGRRAGYGYGNLDAQSGWRLEKARRQARQLGALLDFFGARPAARAPRLLDVGSGYGFLRQAASELGWQHAGIELSRHAGETAQALFHFSTERGILADHAGGDYDCITLLDLVEHVGEPLKLLAQVHSRLAPGGLCVIRTPNLLALEREVFGHRYHSFKREHLHSFSVASLTQALAAADLLPVHASTDAHLFNGFLGIQTQVLARQLRGSDILAAGQKAAA